MKDKLSVENYVEQLEDIFYALASYSPEMPTEEAISDYSRLWSFCRSLRHKEVARSVFTHPKVEALRPQILSMFAEWWYLREMEIARKILDAKDSRAAFNEYCTDFDPYKRIVKLEHQAVNICAAQKLDSVLMVGSGPVSSTAMILHDFGMKVDCVDISPEANELSSGITFRFGMNDRLNYITSDILDLMDLGQYDAVWLAGFVGVEKMKSRIVDHLFEHMCPGAFLLVRSAPMPCNLLYTEIRPWELSAFEQLIHLQPLSMNTHSTYVVRRPGQRGGSA